MDELLFRLNALSDSLHHTLPPKAHRYREDSPVSSPIQEPSDMDAQASLPHVNVNYPVKNSQTHASSTCTFICTWSHTQYIILIKKVSSGKPMLFEQCVVLLQDFVKSQVTEETETVTGCGETLPASHLLR